MDEPNRLHFVQIAVAPPADGYGESLYGLTRTGYVFVYHPAGRCWDAMPMEQRTKETK